MEFSLVGLAVGRGQFMGRLQTHCAGDGMTWRRERENRIVNLQGEQVVNLKREQDSQSSERIG